LLHDPLLQTEIHQLRTQLKQEEKLVPFLEPIIFIFFAPPEYPTHRAATFLSQRMNLPVIFPFEYVTNIDRATGQTIEMQRPAGEGEERGRMGAEDEGEAKGEESKGKDGEGREVKEESKSMGSKGKSDKSKGKESKSEGSEGTERPPDPICGMMNVSTVKMLKRCSSIAENVTRERLRERIERDDCRLGFILFEYPDTIGEMRFFLEHMVPATRVEIIHLKLDNEVRSLTLTCICLPLTH
jgi:hypothetical protein